MGLKPAAIETIDDMVLGLARRDPIYHRVGSMVDPPGQGETRSINLVELASDSESGVEEQRRVLQGRVHAPGGTVCRFDFARSTEGFKLHIGGGPSF